MHDEARQSGFRDVDDINFTGLRVEFAVGHGFHVIHRLDCGSAHPGKSENRQNARYQSQGDHVDIVGSSLLELIVRIVDHPHADILIHEEQRRQEDGRETAKELHFIGDRIDSHDEAPPPGELKGVRHRQGRDCKLFKARKRVERRHGTKDEDRPEILDEAADALVEEFARFEGRRSQRGTERGHGHRQAYERRRQVVRVGPLEASSDRLKGFVDEVDTEQGVENFVREPSAESNQGTRSAQTQQSEEKARPETDPSIDGEEREPLQGAESKQTGDEGQGQSGRSDEGHGLPAEDGVRHSAAPGTQQELDHSDGIIGDLGGDRSETNHGRKAGKVKEEHRRNYLFHILEAVGPV